MSGASFLESAYIVPGYTFFYYGFDLQKQLSPSFMEYFKLGEGHLSANIVLVIRGKPHNAKIRVARQRSPKYTVRDVVQIFYNNELDTLKELRKLFMYSYATTIDKKRPRLKEIMKLEHLGDNRFKVVPFARQETDFDSMFDFMEDKNLFEYWKDRKTIPRDEFFVYSSPGWMSIKELGKYRKRTNAIYLLYHSRDKHLYVGKAIRFGGRVKKGEGRIGLAGDWDKFMFFEVHPKYSAFLEQIEAFAIRTFASILDNDVKVLPLGENGIKLVNKQLISR